MISAPRAVPVHLTLVLSRDCSKCPRTDVKESYRDDQQTEELACRSEAVSHATEHSNCHTCWQSRSLDRVCSPRGGNPSPPLCIDPNLLPEGNAKAHLYWFLHFTKLCSTGRSHPRPVGACSSDCSVWGLGLLELLPLWLQPVNLKTTVEVCADRGFVYKSHSWYSSVTLQRAWICELSPVGFPSLPFPTS